MKRGLVVAAVLAIAIAGSATTPDPRPTIKIAGYWTAAGDSIRVIGRWTRVPDARGRQDSVRYDVRYWADGAVVFTAEPVTGDSITHTFMRRPPGDTVRYSITLRAIDQRGAAGQEVRSPILLVVVPWTPPVTPPITIDTIAAVDVDSLTIYRMGLRVAPYRTGDVGLTFTFIGDTATLCALAWNNDRAGVPGFDIQWTNPETAEHPGGVFTFEDRGGGCALLTALRTTDLPALPGPGQYQAALQRARP